MSEYLIHNVEERPEVTFYKKFHELLDEMYRGTLVVEVFKLWVESLDSEQFAMLTRNESVILSRYSDVVRSEMYKRWFKLKNEVNNVYNKL